MFLLKKIWRRLFGPRHTVQEVAKTLHDGLLNGTITLHKPLEDEIADVDLPIYLVIALHGESTQHDHTFRITNLVLNEVYYGRMSVYRLVEGSFECLEPRTKSVIGSADPLLVEHWVPVPEGKK